MNCAIFTDQDRVLGRPQTMLDTNVPAQTINKGYQCKVIRDFRGNMRCGYMHHHFNQGIQFSWA